jgi:hypothetical protein
MNNNQSKRWFRVEVREAESLHGDYIQAVGRGMARNLMEATRAAEKNCQADLGRIALERWQGFGGVPVLRTVITRTPGGETTIRYQ